MSHVFTIIKHRNHKIYFLKSSDVDQKTNARFATWSTDVCDSLQFTSLAKVADFYNRHIDEDKTEAIILAAPV